MLELKETKMIKVVALYEQTPKQFETDPNPQNFCPKKPKQLPINQMKLKVRSEGDIRKHIIFCYMSRPIFDSMGTQYIYNLF